MAPPDVEECLKRQPKLRKSDLEHLQEWMRKQPHLPALEDIDLVPVLNRRDYSLEQTKEHIDRYLTMRTHAPEIFKYRDPTSPAVMEQYKYFHAARAGVDDKGNHMVCAGLNPEDVSNLDIETAAYLAFAFIEVQVRYFPVEEGCFLILDASNLTAGHIAKLSITILKKVLAYIQDSCLAKITAVHVIRLNPLVDKVMILVKPLLNQKTQELLHFHSTKNMDEFYKAVPKNLLPSDYGGTLDHSKVFHKQLIDDLKANADWLQSLDKRVVDESKRPGRAKGEGDVFGVEGSFKKLEVD